MFSKLVLIIGSESWGEGEFTENAGHDGDAGILNLALGVVDAQGLERWKTDCLVSACHFGGIGRGGLD